MPSLQSSLFFLFSASLSFLYPRPLVYHPRCLAWCLQSVTQSSYIHTLPSWVQLLAHTQNWFSHQPPTYIFHCNFRQIILLSRKQSSPVEFTPLLFPFFLSSLPCTPGPWVPPYLIPHFPCSWWAHFSKEDFQGGIVWASQCLNEQLLWTRFSDSDFFLHVQMVGSPSHSGFYVLFGAN